MVLLQVEGALEAEAFLHSAEKIVVSCSLYYSIAALVLMVALVVLHPALDAPVALFDHFCWLDAIWESHLQTVLLPSQQLMP